jgi:uncharacterized protein YegP (UPF0339 family)
MTPYSYFINGDDKTGYWWTLVRPNDDDVCRSDVYAKKADCLSSLRAAQRHAATAEVVDESV